MEISITAAILVIGDEILSGRTLDSNSNTIACFLAPFGISVKEIRVVPDEKDEIIAAVKALSNKFTYVFTTGGIGPTHDDITADCIAESFGLGISERADAIAELLKKYKPEELTESRKRMARIPDGASLINNPVSFAPGFQTENVFTMAGVPHIMRAMLEDIAPRLKTGKIVIAKTIAAEGLKEGDVAIKLGEIAKKYPALSFGSYPWFRPEGFGAQLVVRGTDETLLNEGVIEVTELVKSLGLAPIVS